MMLVRWVGGVSLKDQKRSEDLCSILGIHVVRRGRMRWFEHIELSVGMIGCRLAEIRRWQG